ncbi:PIN domain-containing protein [Thiothrix fructosivorans]|uniref:PIN domain-containing protein n=1 Tax=Thiothrix fructosivorans TaxID=111770 RepID=A0A8B0SHE5_9GAMM|nr:PIN domain-containing protein [Thiothrix fructosivorans]MBO0611793.1 PIN domain-containing protein [Thiothrix fructosivorans]QTX10551.1 PIN domain-containing protein [Thiothrix fructosivorans]
MIAGHNFTVLYDACVLYPAPLRDLLVRLARMDVFQAKWTHQIHEEWIRNALKNNPKLTRERLGATANKMNEAVMDSLVTNYEPLIAGLELPDTNDRHVLAAAIKGQAEVIVTFNLKDFPQSHLKPFDIWAQHPDEFISHLIDLSPETVLLVARQQRLSLKNPPRTVEEFLDTLLRQQLPRTVAFLKQRKDLI